MFSSRHPYRIALAACVAALVLALPARSVALSVSIFCVNAPGCPAGAVDEDGDLQKALNDAEATPGNDSILLGDKGSPYVGPFQYGGKLPIGDTVTIFASGPGRPVLTAPGGSTVIAAGDTTMVGIDVRLADAHAGIGIDAEGNVQLSDINVVGPANGAGATGIRTAGSVTIDGSHVSGTGADGIVVTQGDLTVSHSQTDGVDIGIDAAPSTLDVDTSRIAAKNAAIGTDATTSVLTSVLQTSGPGSFGVNSSGGSVTLDHDTIVHPGPVGGTDAALDFTTVDSPGRANISSVSLAGYTRGIRRDTTDTGDPYPIAIRDSVWDSSHDLLGDATSGPFQESGDAHVAPALVDLAGGDFRPRGSSAAIYRDTLTNGRYTDIDGVAAVDGNGDGTALADAGAFEYRRRSPSIDAANVAGSGATGTLLAFSSVGSDPDGDQLQTVWSFGDGAVGAGARTTHAYTAPGVYHVDLRVIDEAGLSATRTFTVAVTGGGSPGPSGSVGTPAPPSPAGAHPHDHAAPHLQGVRLVPSRLRIAHAGRLRLRFHLDERAVIRIVAQPRGGAHSVAGRGAILASARSGNGSIALAAGLKRLHLLHAGRVLLSITATDAAGNRSAPARAQLSITK